MITFFEQKRKEKDFSILMKLILILKPGRQAKHVDPGEGKVNAPITW